MLFLPSSLLIPEAVHLDLIVPDRDSAIHAAAALLGNHPGILDADEFARAVLEREHLHSTALPCGVAFPHARKPIVRDMVLSAVRLQTAVPFDDIMVRLVFLIGTPPNRTADHLALLAWLAKKMGDEAVRNRMLDAHTPQEFCDCLSDAAPGHPSHE